MSTSVSQLQSKVQRFTHFLTTRLEPDLAAITERLQHCSAELQRWNELKASLDVVQKALDLNTQTQIIDTLYNLGSDCYTPSVVSKDDLQQHIMLHVGCSVYVEMSRSEALKFIDIKCKVVNETISRYETLAAHVRTQISTVYAGIGELMQMQSHEEEEGQRRNKRRSDR